MYLHSGALTGAGMAAIMLWLVLGASGCATAPATVAGETRPLSAVTPNTAGTGTPLASASTRTLANTQWRLVAFQSMDDAIGTTRPSDPSLYVMRLNADGTVTMRLDCNRATGTWSAEPGSDIASGRFEFGPLAATHALCAPPRLDESIVAQARYVRSYLLADGKLYLSLMADGGIYAWEPDSGAAVTPTAPAAPKDTGPRN